MIIGRYPRSKSSGLDTRFIIEVTMGAGESFTMPTIAGYNYNYTVDWGDGSAIDTITAFDQAERIHDYTASGAGVYTIITEGLCQTWNFYTVNTSALKLTKIVNLGNMGWTSFDSTFRSCANLTECSGGDTSLVTNMSGVFGSCTSLTTLDVSSWNTSLVTNMTGVFGSCTSLTTLDVSLWNTALVTNMSYMFYSCSSLTTLDVSSLWNTSLVTNMSTMFYSCYSLTTLDLSSWNTSKVTNMSSMFGSCTSLTTLDVSSLWNTSKVTNMSYMFRSCYSLTTLDLSSWNTSLVTNMSHMFYYATKLTSIVSLDCQSVTITTSMTTGCTSLATGTFVNMAVTFSLLNCNFSDTGIEAIGDSLATVIGQTITLTGNPGALTFDDTVMVGKGWTVVKS